MAESLLAHYHRIRKIKKTLGAKLKPIPKAVRPKFPYIIEAHYKALIWSKLDALWEKVKPILEAQIPKIISQASKQGVPQRDEWIDEYSAMEEMLEATYGDFLEEEELENMVSSLGSSISQFNGKDLARVLAVIGGTNTLAETWIKPHIGSFVKENVELITSIKRDQLGQVKNVILRGIRGGYRYEEIMKNIESRFDVSKSRAKLIARDQVAKFNGNLSKVRQVHAGISKYEWDTAHDERVRGRPGGLYPTARPSHWAQQGKVIDWDSGGAPGIGHPGEAIQCRCVAMPIFDEEDED